MNKLSYILVIGSLLIGMIGCDDDNSTSPESDIEEELNGLAVVLERTGDTEIEIAQGSYADADISLTRFCYENEGCEEVSGGSTESFGGTYRYIMESSDYEKQVVGVIVEFEVDAGEGIVDVVEGTHEESGGFMKFEEEEVKKSESFKKGDVIQFSYGNTE